MASVDSVGTMHRQSLLVLIWASFSVAFFFVGLRSIIRFRITPRPTAEDYWLFLGLASLLALCILENIQLTSLYYMTAVIEGKIQLSQQLISYTEEYLRLEFPIVVLFWTVLWSVKASFLALYFKLFRELPLYRRVWFVLAVFTFLAYAGCWISFSLSCGELSNFFEFAQCGSPQDIWASNLNVYYSTVVDVFTDLCIMAMPIRLIYNVKISPKQKAGLVCVFGLCFVMIAFSIIRAKQILVQQYFVNLTLLMIWSTLAASISVIIGSLPALKIFVTNRNTAKRSRQGSSNGGKKQPSSNHSVSRNRSIPLRSISSEKKSDPARCPGTSESQEEMLKSEGNQFILVKHDITVSYNEMNRPPPIYHQSHPISNYGQAI